MAHPVGLTPPLIDALREVARGLKKPIPAQACETLITLGYIERHLGHLYVTAKGQRYLNSVARRKRKKT